MALSFSQLVSPLNQASWVQFLLSSLQGVGPVIQGPGVATNQLFGTGAVSIQGPAQVAASVVVKITTSGNASTSNPAFFQYSVDGGLTYNPVSPVSMASLSPTFSYALSGVNVSVTFINGSYQTAGSGGNYFVAGETYSFQLLTPTFPVTNWTAIGVGNSLVQTDAQALADLDILGSQASAGGFTQSWINPPVVNGTPTPPPDGWCDLLAQNIYNRQRGQAQQTQGVGLLTANANAGPYTISAGQLTASNPGGQYLFTNITGGTLSRGGSLNLTWQALQPGAAYNQVESYGIGSSAFWLTNMVSPLAGVSLTNPLQSNPSVYFAGLGTGAISVAASTGGPAGEYNVVIKIISSGAAGVGTFAYSLDGGNSYTVPMTIASSFTIGATNMIASFSSTFTAGDLYSFSTSWITQRGADIETSRQLAIDCQNQWSTLAASGSNPTGQYVLWAKAASPEVVTAFVVQDPLTPGQVDITLIGANNGPVSSAAIAAVQAYINNRIGLCLTAVVGTVSQLSVATAAAYIVTQSQYRNTVQASIQQLFNVYTNGILPTGTVSLSKVAEIIQEAQGVIEINPLSSLTLNGTAADIQLTKNQTALLVTPALTSFKFV